MEENYWLQRWKEKRIGFHEGHANSLLTKYINLLNVPKNARFFVPLCGKTLDIPWLLSQGYKVVGAELSQIAIDELFEELKVRPEIPETGSLQHYKHQNLEIFVGNIFDLTKEELGHIDAIYDRAALVALPKEMRDRYTKHLVGLTNAAPQILLCFEYDQALVAGPPFSVSRQEIQEQYSKSYGITFLTAIDVPGGLKGEYPAKETAWLLKSI